MLAEFSALTDLAGSLRPIRAPSAEQWPEINSRFQEWTHRAGLRSELKAHLGTLSTTGEAMVLARSRETTTHFAWCLLDEPGDPFSVWLHEYKPHGDWRPGYADSVHNHRYHFCTTIVSGAYTHQRFAVDLAAEGTSIRTATLQRSAVCRAGTGGYLLAHEFHRIPTAEDGTMTLLVKSRSVSPWSLSYDPLTRQSHQHVPVENRLGELVARL